MKTCPIYVVRERKGAREKERERDCKQLLFSINVKNYAWMRWVSLLYRNKPLNFWMYCQRYESAIDKWPIEMMCCNQLLDSLMATTLFRIGFWHFSMWCSHFGYTRTLHHMYRCLNWMHIDFIMINELSSTWFIEKFRDRS